MAWTAIVIPIIVLVVATAMVSVLVTRAWCARRFATRERRLEQLGDNMLQTFQAIILRLHITKEGLPQGSAGRVAMDRFLDDADRLMNRARDAFAAWRGEQCGQGDVVVHLRRFGRDLANRHGCRLSVRVHGRPVPLAPVVCDEVRWILSEAMGNAALHAEASRIRVSIDFRADQFSASVEDNGRGLGDDVVLRTGQDGRRGMHLMSERAARIGGRLTVSMRSGTAIELRLAGDIAYGRRNGDASAPG
ncbi:sensor histidine kinase [Luteibacter pinisoli]|nr:ATP-binding protein [Luteibacter pinisoli]